MLSSAPIRKLRFGDIQMEAITMAERIAVPTRVYAL